MKKVLVVVDMQNDFVDGALGSPEAQAIVDNVCEKVNKFEGDIIVTFDTHQDNYLETQEGKKLPVVHCVKDTAGWELCDKVYDAIEYRCKDAGCNVQFFKKPTFGSVNMANYLLGMNTATHIDEIVLVGLCTDICVVSNALLLKAFLPDTNIIVDASCCAGVTPESHKAALQTMKMCQIEVIGEDL